MRRAALLLLALAACAKNIDPAGNTGDDGVYRGAEPIQLVQDPVQKSISRGDDEGIVSYPGGDRVDWKAIEIPADRTGKLVLELSWESPRPGGDLAFIVYDQWGQKLEEVKPSRKRGKRTEHSKDATAQNVRGTVYVEIYAANRADAGEYELGVTFHDETRIIVSGEPPDVPLPPKLAQVYKPCDKKAPDRTNPDCEGVPDPVAPEPEKVCPNPQKPDRTIKDCVQYFPQCDVYDVDELNPNCDGVPEEVYPPVAVELTSEKKSGDKVEIIIPLGSDDGVEIGQQGEFLDASGKVIENSGFTVLSVKPRTCTAKTKLSEAMVRKNKTVRIYIPYQKKTAP
jgi:hypothetical protein